MTKRMVAAAVALTTLLALAGCSDYESQSERVDRLYAECLAAGGSFEYNGSLPYWQCAMPEEAQ